MNLHSVFTLAIIVLWNNEQKFTLDYRIVIEESDKPTPAYIIFFYWDWCFILFLFAFVIHFKKHIKNKCCYNVEPFLWRALSPSTDWYMKLQHVNKIHLLICCHNKKLIKSTNLKPNSSKIVFWFRVKKEHVISLDAVDFPRHNRWEVNFKKLFRQEVFILDHTKKQIRAFA